MEVQIRDGEILKADPQEMIAHVAVPFWKWFEDSPFA
jgi:hypothetical protein